MTTSPPRWATRTLGVLSFFDRYGMAPMVVTIAAVEGIGLAGAAQLIGIHVLFYAVCQPVWGLLGDRFGRSTVLRIALVLVIAGALATVLATGLPALLAARALAGFGAGALFPTVLALIGDAMDRRAATVAIADLQTFTAIGISAAAVLGAVAAYGNWRLAFVLVGLAAVVASWGLRKTASARTSVPDRARPWAGVFAPRALWLYVLGAVEGGILLGVIVYLAPAIERSGQPALVAGLLTAVYGIVLIAASRVRASLVGRMSRPGAIAIGGAALTAGYLVAAVGSSSPVMLTLSCVALAVANAFLHTAVLQWATELAPAARGTAVAVFVCALFAGAAAAVLLAAGSVAAGRFDLVFGVTAACAAAVAIALALTDRVFQGGEAR